MKGFFYFKNFKTEISNLTNECLLYQENKPKPKDNPHIAGTVATKEPFIHISSDIVGPFFAYNFKSILVKDKFWLITVIDRYTRTVKIKIAKRIDSQELIEILEVWCKQYGKPKTLKNYQSKQYLSKAFND